MPSRPPVLRLLGCLAAAALAASVAARPAAAAQPNDPAWPMQWGPVLINAPEAWDRASGAGIVVGVVDTGIHLTHEDLADKVVAHASCIGASGDPAACRAGEGHDDNGHGTHVAGIAAATTDNGRGIAGVAPGARLVVARALENDPFGTGTASGTVSDIAAGIRWVVDNGARVVNLSIGDIEIEGDGAPEAMRSAIEYAWSRGAVAVLAAGNSQLLGFGSQNYGELNAVVVGAVGRNGGPAYYSSPTGDAKWAVMAPGGNRQRFSSDDQQEIFSTWWTASNDPNTYAYAQGTSMAVPHVVGALALVLSQPGVTTQRAVDLVLETAAGPEDSCATNSPTCQGLIDAAAAVAAASANPVATSTTVTSTTTTTTTVRPRGTRSTTTAPAAVASPSTTTTVAGGTVPGSLPAGADEPPTTTGSRSRGATPSAAGQERSPGPGGGPPLGLSLLAALGVLGTAGWAGWLVSQQRQAATAGAAR